jgi:prepilin-type N-terminal cleavage/methylation domain-containing protein
MWVLKSNRQGFTIVELLIVIVVIGILAAITIVAYNGIQSKAKAASLSSTLAQVSEKLALFQIDNADNYPATLTLAGINDGNGTTYQYSVDNNASPKSFCVTATTGTFSYYTDNITHSTPTAGACVGHVNGGSPNIINIALNPGVAVNANRYSSWGGGSGGVTTVSKVSVAWTTSGFASRGAWTAANNAYAGDSGYNSPSVNDGSFDPNTQYTATWKVVSSKSQRISPAAYNWTIPNGASGSGTGTNDSSAGPSIVAAGVPTSQWVTFTTGSNTTGLKVYSTLVSGAGASYWQVGDYLDIGELMIVKGNVKYAYGDGNSTGWSWNGAVGASSSFGPAP